MDATRNTNRIGLKTSFQDICHKIQISCIKTSFSKVNLLLIGLQIIYYWMRICSQLQKYTQRNKKLFDIITRNNKFMHYLSLLLEWNQEYDLCNEHFGQFHRSKCKWLVLCFLAIPMLDNDPTLFCQCKRLVMFQVFSTSAKRK